MIVCFAKIVTVVCVICWDTEYIPFSWTVSDYEYLIMKNETQRSGYSKVTNINQR